MRKLAIAALAGVALLAIGCGGKPSPSPTPMARWEIKTTFFVCDMVYNAFMRQTLDDSEGSITSHNPITGVEPHVHDAIVIFYNSRRTFEQAQAIIAACADNAHWIRPPLPGVTVTPTSL